MIIECPECGTKNTTDKPLQPSKRYRCGKCGAVITILQTAGTQGGAASTPDKNSVYETSSAVLKVRKGQNWSDFLKPDGRFSRSQYALILIAANAIDWTLSYIIYGAWGFLIVCYLFTTYVVIIAGIRRLHDLNYSGWYFLFLFVPFANIVLLLYLLFASGKIEGNRWA